MRTAHLGQRFKCDICISVFSKLESLQYHMEAHYGNIVRKTCPSCGKTFFSTKGLYLHKKSVHERITFPCECGKDFKFLASLKSHKKAIHGVGIKEIHYCQDHEEIHQGQESKTICRESCHIQN